MMEEFTREEIEFLKTLLSQLNIRPAQPDAHQVVDMVQRLLQKLSSLDSLAPDSLDNGRKASTSAVA
jgi:hypothetical protein